MRRGWSWVLAMLDGRQYILVAAGDTLYAFTLY